MLENFLNTVLETEMDEHLAENNGKDQQNGKMRKTVQSEYGPVEIQSLPRNRDGSFEPEVVKKRETISRILIAYDPKSSPGAVISRAIYNILGVDRYESKDLLGLYVSQKRAPTSG